MVGSKINLLLQKIPNLPGVYKMKDSDGNIIYVGKAKSLKKRVTSYFRKQKNMTVRTKKMVEKIDDLEWIEVGSDLEALLLETNFIKEFRPKYNVLMKDDKNFVYLKITDEDFPRIEIVRKVLKDGAKYFGPKTSAHKLEKTLRVLQKIFNYRSCSLNIEWLKIGNVKVSNKTIAYPCLDYHIKRCDAPCIANVTPEQYKNNIKQIRSFFEGKTKEIETSLNGIMKEAAISKNFESAAKIRDKLNAIKNLMEKQIISSPDHTNADIISFVLDNEKSYFNLFMLREGKLINVENFIFDAPSFFKEDEENADEVIESFLFDYYQKAAQIPDEILIPLDLHDDSLFSDFINNLGNKKIKVVSPLRGIKHALLDLAHKNADGFRKQHIAKWGLSSNDDSTALSELAQKLGSKKHPFRIECYDISHLSGTDTVASMVVFEQGIPKSSDYRKFRIRTLKSGEIDDYKSIEEVIFRRLMYLSKSFSDFYFRRKKTSFSAFYKKKILCTVDVVKSGNMLLLLKFPVLAFKNHEGIESLFLKYILKITKTHRAYLAGNHEKLLESMGFEKVKKIPDEFMQNVRERNTLFFVFDRNKDIDSSFAARPDLMVIDGGKGQLSSAIKSRDKLKMKIPIISLAKREEEVFVESQNHPLDLPRNSQASFLLQRIRDEAHRFAISYQKNSRKKSIRDSALDEIPGLGDKTKMKLLKHFGSLEMIRSANVEEIMVLTGKDLAERIVAHLNN